MAMLVPLEAISGTLLARMLRYGGKILTLENRRYVRIDEVSYAEAYDDLKRSDKCAPSQ